MSDCKNNFFNKLFCCTENIVKVIIAVVLIGLAVAVISCEKPTDDIVAVANNEFVVDSISVKQASPTSKSNDLVFNINNVEYIGTLDTEEFNFEGGEVTRFYNLGTVAPDFGTEYTANRASIILSFTQNAAGQVTVTGARVAVTAVVNTTERKTFAVQVDSEIEQGENTTSYFGTYNGPGTIVLNDFTSQVGVDIPFAFTIYIDKGN